MKSDLHDLELLLDSKVPILVIESYEEPRVLEMLTGLAVTRTLPLFVWSITEGLNRLGFGEKPEEGDQLDETGVLEAIKNETSPGLYVLCDFHPYLKGEARNIRLLHEIAMRHNRLGHTVVLLSHQIELTNEVKRYSARFELSMPTEEQLMHLVREEASNWSRSKGGVPVRSSSDTFKKLVQNLKGVPIEDTRQLVRAAIYDDGVIDDSDIPDMNKAKFALMDMEGMLSFQYDTAQFGEVGGLVKLKEWLERREDSFLEGESSQDSTHFDLGLLADISEGFSGAEIEQVIVSALYSVTASDAELSIRRWKMPFMEPTRFPRSWKKKSGSCVRGPRNDASSQMSENR